MRCGEPHPAVLLAHDGRERHAEGLLQEHIRAPQPQLLQEDCDDAHPLGGAELGAKQEDGGEQIDRRSFQTGAPAGIPALGVKELEDRVGKVAGAWWVESNGSYRERS